MVHAELCRAPQFRKTFNEKFKNIVVKILYQPFDKFSTFDDFSKDKNETFCIICVL